MWGAPPAFPDAGAGLVSTVDDYFAFSRLLLHRGVVAGRRLLSEASITAMTANRLTPEQRAQGRPILSEGGGWGLGMSVVVDPAAEGLPPGAVGWDGGLGTTWVADPRSSVTAILLTNTMFTSPQLPQMHREFRSAVFQAQAQSE